jgi:hypothetical protein
VDPARTAQGAAAAVAAVAAVVMATTVDKSPNKKKIRRRWMLRIERHVRTFVWIGDWLYIRVDSSNFSEQMFCIF